MVEIQSCGGLVNDSALCGIEEQVKVEVNDVNVNVIAAELEKEREKNQQLLERISLLEAQIQQRDYLLHHHNQSPLIDTQKKCIVKGTKRHIKKFKKHETETRTENGNLLTSEFGSNIAKNDESIHLGDAKSRDSVVNWMSMDDTRFLDFNHKRKDVELEHECNETDETEEECDEDCYEDQNVRICNEVNQQVLDQVNKFDPQMVPCFGSCFSDQNELKVQKACPPRKSSNKVPFCPKEVNRMLESGALLSENAQSHTIRKIIVFASLGIRHGCEDMYELDFNHFSILHKGEPYVSPKNPGEHVLYENPGVRRKVFYPNRQNPTLCPVRILEEEKAMRPEDPSCPSCLFLCIKYGGRTRNLPQNEYVRQRMGRNKLKSFGPVMCRMAMLVHVRSGSFFFKALGITLLFMAGFPDDMVQRETKYRNLDLLQKYYRTDKDAEREELFLPHQETSDTASPSSQPMTEKTPATKSKLKKQVNGASRPNKQQKSSVQQSVPSSSLSPTHFGPVEYTSIQTHAMAAFQSTPSQNPADMLLVSNQSITNPGANVSYHNQTPFYMFPPQPSNTFMPMIYWPPPNAFPLSPPFPATYGYSSFPCPASYVSVLPQTYSIRHPASSPCVPKIVEDSRKNDVVSEDSDSTSSSSEPKDVLDSCK